MTRKIFGCWLSALISLSSFTLHAAADAPVETLSEDFEVEVSRLKCVEFAAGNVGELAWPHERDPGPAAALARLAGEHLRRNHLFLSEFSSQIDCAAINRWLTTQAHTVKGRFYISRKHEVHTFCPVSRDEAVGCTYTLREVGFFQVFLGENPPQQLAVDGPRFAVHADGLVWQVPFANNLSSPSTTPIQIPDTPIEPNFSDLLGLIRERQEASEQLDLSRYDVGTEVAVAKSEFIGELATITELLGDGRANVTYPGIIRNPSQLLYLSELGIVVPEIDGFRPTDRVKWYDSGVRKYHYGTLKRVFSNGFVEVKYDDAGIMIVKATKFTHL